MKHYSIRQKQEGEIDCRHLSAKARQYLDNTEPIAVYKVDWAKMERGEIVSVDRYDVVEDGDTISNLTFEGLDEYLCECQDAVEIACEIWGEP